MRTSETRCYLDLSSLNGNRESVLSMLAAEAANENRYIAAVYENGSIREIHSKICVSELAEKLGISRKNIEIY